MLTFCVFTYIPTSLPFHAEDDSLLGWSVIQSVRNRQMSQMLLPPSPENITLIMEGVSFSETSSNFCQATRCNIREVSRLHTRRRNNLKTHLCAENLSLEVLFKTVITLSMLWMSPSYSVWYFSAIWRRTTEKVRLVEWNFWHWCNLCFFWLKTSLLKELCGEKCCLAAIDTCSATNLFLFEKCNAAYFIKF